MFNAATKIKTTNKISQELHKQQLLEKQSQFMDSIESYIGAIIIQNFLMLKLSLEFIRKSFAPGRTLTILGYTQATIFLEYASIFIAKMWFSFITKVVSMVFLF